MYNYLLDHAVQNVWCNPEQDNQRIIAAQRISSNGGELNKVRVANRKIRLPELNKYYHVYQIGQINPSVLGLLNVDPNWKVEEWVCINDAINTLKLIVNIYNIDGIELPRYKSWVMFSNDRALLIAVEDNSIYKVNFSLDTIYMRLYTNAYFKSMRSSAIVDYIYSYGKDIKTTSDINELETKYNTYKAKYGYTYAYVNGFIVNDLNLSTMHIGDQVELLYDSSVKRIVTFVVKDLHVFTSELDRKYKYLLHYPKVSDQDNIIDYWDDNDIHVLYGDRTYKGRYYHHNGSDAVRMVTHRDYSIAVDYVDAISRSMVEDISPTAPLDIRTFKIQLKIRKSGYHRALVQDHHRIFEMYKLSDERVYQSLIGLHSTVPEWSASSLEKSGYTEIMRTQFGKISIDMIQRGYGYNAISKLVGDTPTKTKISKTNVPVAELPYNLHSNCTVYEYDSFGYLVGWHEHTLGTDYECHNVNTKMIEVISGKGTYKPHVVFGVDQIPIDTNVNYRVYLSISAEGTTEVWEDITGGVQYKIVNGKLVWNDLLTGYKLMIRYDDTFLAYDLSLSPIAGTFYFSLSEMQNRTGLDENRVLPVPMGELDIFLNGKSLIRGIDYIVRFPMVHILNKEYLLQPSSTTEQSVHVRFTGFCKSNLEMDDIEDFGYVVHGVLSNNNRFDIRDDKVLRIVMGGKTLHRDDVVFSELHSGISVSNPINGRPYQIKDIVVPMKGLTEENTYSLRAKSMEVDKRVSDYMTIQLPQPPRDAVSAIQDRYAVVSPFIAHIVNDLVTGLIDTSLFNEGMTDNDVIEACKPYEHILHSDPIYFEPKLDSRFVIIHPHNLDTVVVLSLINYRFLMRVVKLYCHGLVELSPFISFLP